MFQLGDEMELLVETARSFANDSLAPALRASEEAREVAGPIRDAYAQIGLESGPELLKISRDMITVMRRWARLTVSPRRHTAHRSASETQTSS